MQEQDGASQPGLPVGEELRRLSRAGRAREAVAMADRLLAGQLSDRDRVTVLLAKITALLNLDQVSRCAPLIDTAFGLLQRLDAPALLGRLHALAAGMSRRHGALDRCLAHLVHAARALELAGPAGDTDAATAWLVMSVVYSRAGFHEMAAVSLGNAQRVAAEAGLPPGPYTHPEVQLRWALWLDHHGDTAGCLRELSALASGLGPDDVVAQERPFLAYAGARMAALGAVPPRDPLAVLGSHEPQSPQGQAMVDLVRVCLALAAGRSAEALSRLEAPGLTGQVTEAEAQRLRALAHRAAGDLEAALEAERAVVRASAPLSRRLRALCVDGVAARLDQDELRRNMSRYSDEAQTDALTGLPNRRHLERFVADLTAHGGTGTVGVGDLDGFKAVNTVHGHLSGDAVLQQVAAILTRVLRSADFCARYGGDEFVVVLPGTGLPEAGEVAARLAAAVSGFDWATLVPGTPVALTVGLAELTPGGTLAEAFGRADLAMLRSKPRPS
ncbi:GGDEF domain-containing protein [Longispora albida]|uniref:GGDEF domain-containing protein n=1 Tax=Longispora albida TaxID=203523 RepID=UPI00039DAE71|nr:GGDEF domain-containing protein [Longispora albida]